MAFIISRTHRITKLTDYYDVTGSFSPNVLSARIYEKKSNSEKALLDFQKADVDNGHDWFVAEIKSFDLNTPVEVKAPVLGDGYVVQFKATRASDLPTCQPLYLPDVRLGKRFTEYPGYYYNVSYNCKNPRFAKVLSAVEAHKIADEYNEWNAIHALEACVVHTSSLC